MSVDAIKRFAQRHAETVAVLEAIGSNRIRIVLVGTGGFGDVIADSTEQATQWCADAGVTLAEWDHRTVSGVTISEAYRRWMGTAQW